MKLLLRKPFFSFLLSLAFSHFWLSSRFYYFLFVIFHSIYYSFHKLFLVYFCSFFLISLFYFLSCYFVCQFCYLFCYPILFLSDCLWFYVFLQFLLLFLFCLYVFHSLSSTLLSCSPACNFYACTALFFLFGCNCHLPLPAPAKEGHKIWHPNYVNGESLMFAMLHREQTWWIKENSACPCYVSWAISLLLYIISYRCPIGAALELMK